MESCWVEGTLWITRKCWKFAKVSCCSKLLRHEIASAAVRVQQQRHVPLLDGLVAIAEDLRSCLCCLYRPFKRQSTPSCRLLVWLYLSVAGESVKGLTEDPARSCV